MSEIEKMYENAWVDPKREKEITIDATTDKENYHNVYYGYPPFTAEKQIELIKWLIDEVDYITMWHFNNSKKPYDFDLGSHNSGGETFEDALAQMINKHWQDLTEEEKQQVKEILNG